jgi:hypothetical protein
MGKSCDRRVEQDRALGSAHAKMNTMQYYNTSFVRIASANLLGILTALGLNGTVLAAGTCIEGPKAGRHWDYRVDPANHRKCWYVTGTGLKTQEGAPLQPTPSPTSTPNSTLLSWFASLSTSPAGSVSPGRQPSTTRESGVPPTAPNEALQVVHTVPKKRLRPARRFESKGATTAERNQQPPSRSSAEHAEQINTQPPDQAAQDALFLEFLRWKELQKSVN